MADKFDQAILRFAIFENVGQVVERRKWRRDGYQTESEI